MGPLTAMMGNPDCSNGRPTQKRLLQVACCLHLRALPATALLETASRLAASRSGGRAVPHCVGLPVATRLPCLRGQRQPQSSLQRLQLSTGTSAGCSAPAAGSAMTECAELTPHGPSATCLPKLFTGIEGKRTQERTGDRAHGMPWQLPVQRQEGAPVPAAAWAWTWRRQSEPGSRATAGCCSAAGLAPGTALSAGPGPPPGEPPRTPARRSCSRHPLCKPCNICVVPTRTELPERACRQQSGRHSGDLLLWCSRVRSLVEQSMRKWDRIVFKSTWDDPKRTGGPT